MRHHKKIQRPLRLYSPVRKPQFTRPVRRFDEGDGLALLFAPKEFQPRRRRLQSLLNGHAAVDDVGIGVTPVAHLADPRIPKEPQDASVPQRDGRCAIPARPPIFAREEPVVILRHTDRPGRIGLPSTVRNRTTRHHHPRRTAQPHSDVPFCWPGWSHARFRLHSTIICSASHYFARQPSNAL